MAQWGLLPRWAKSAKLAHQLINARAETLKDKSAFKELLGSHRCLVPCDGFYEWRHEGPQRLPHFVHRPDGHLLAMAGLWSRWRSADGLDVDTFTVITTRASTQLQSLHDRMPIFLDTQGRQRWLSGPTADFASLDDLLHPLPDSLEITQVSQHVNSVSVDDERCLEPPSSVQLRLL